MKTIHLLTGLLIISLSLSSPLHAQSDCGLESRLQIGQMGLVAEGAANNVRAEPNPDAARIGRLEAGAAFTVLDGSTCQGGYTWRQISYAAATETITGWTVESDSAAYFLEPLDGRWVSLGGVSFALPAAVADDTELRYYRRILPTPEAPWDNEPEGVALALLGFKDNGDRHNPRPVIEIYAADAFDGVNTAVGEKGRGAVKELRTLLKERPILSSFSAGVPLPDNFPSTIPTMFALRDYLDFQNGSGSRFVTFYPVSYAGPRYPTLNYRFLGLTTDGRYFVSINLPIEAPDVPGPFNPEKAAFSLDDFFAYLTDTGLFFDQIAPEAYKPSLYDLDAVVKSLHVDSSALEAYMASQRDL